MKDSLIHIPFYTGEYSNLMRQLTQRERGAYFDLVSAYVINDGFLPEGEKLYRLTGAFCDEEREAINNVLNIMFERVENNPLGFIWVSQKLTDLLKKQKNLRDRNIANGKKGGRPKNPKRKQSESESESELKTEPEPELFNSFWIKFPRQRIGNKENALKAFKKAIERESVDKIMAGLEKYINSSEVKDGYAKGAAAWLNDDRWNNEYTTQNKGHNNAKSNDDPYAALGLNFNKDYC